MNWRRRWIVHYDASSEQRLDGANEASNIGRRVERVQSAAGIYKSKKKCEVQYGTFNHLFIVRGYRSGNWFVKRTNWHWIPTWFIAWRHWHYHRCLHER